MNGRLLAGHETTINLLCNGTLAFIQHPYQRAELKKDPGGAAKLATEECLRYDSPVPPSWGHGFLAPFD
jgi:cytochrome P450